MKKPELIECILEMKSDLPRTALGKFKKKELQTIYDSLINGENVNDLMTISRQTRQKTEKKEVKIIDFSSDEEADTEVLEDPLPTDRPVLKRQDAQSFKKMSELDYKNEIKSMLQPFSREVKQMTTDFKDHRDNDMLLHEYEILVKDTEDRLHEYLTSIDASDTLYNYSADVMDISNRFIERITS
jgi:hypothetical protein